MINPRKDQKRNPPAGVFEKEKKKKKKKGEGQEEERPSHVFLS